MPDDIENQQEGNDAPAEDKSSEKNEDMLADIPNEDDDDAPAKNDDGEDKPKVDRSEVAQKIKWREKARTLQSELKSLKEQFDTKLKDLETRKGDGTPDDKERAALEFIRKQAELVFEEKQKLREAEENAVVREFEDAVDGILEDNSDVQESELLDVIEEFSVEPDVALKILRKTQEKMKDKPKMPAAKRGSPQVKTEKPTEKSDKPKDFWAIARQAKDEFKRLVN